jgi:2-methylcitrate dehydratase PrpD
MRGWEPVCEPIEQKRRPKVMIDAQFSVPFNAALALTAKRVLFGDFTPQNFAAPRSLDGRTLSASVHRPKCNPRNPLSQDEVVAKHRSIVAGIVDDQTDDAILDFILQLEDKPKFAELTRILRGFVLQ